MRFCSTVVVASLILWSCVENLPSPEISNPDLSYFTDYHAWNQYYNDSLQFSESFTAFDLENNLISKQTFLNFLLSGNYFPLRFTNRDSLPSYRLIQIPKNIDDKLRRLITGDLTQRIELELSYDRMKGIPLPQFSTVDINNNPINSKDLIGRTIVLNTWFINCAQCILEIPSLNVLVKRYAEDSTIVFIALALDENRELTTFLSEKLFLYRIVPDQKQYIEQLGLPVFPTHIIVNKEGYIIKITNDVSELSYALARLKR